MLTKNRIKQSVIWLVLVTVLCMIGPRNVLADNAYNPPSGLKLEGLFKTPGGRSNSKIVPSADGKSELVQITQAETNRKGAIWSVESNKLNLNENFNSTMYLYFGNKGKDAADGITFVLHNDPDGTYTYGPSGQSIGVWREYLPNINYLDPDSAVKNSFAIEFDTYYNKNDNNQLDYDFDIASNVLGTNHIAWNYPDKDSTYYRSGTSQRMRHQDIQYSGWLSDDKWHTLKVNWNASTKKFTYQLDSLTPVSVPLNATDVFKTDKVYWGFTGSTGYQFALNHVAFDEIPGLVNAKVGLDVVDPKTQTSVLGKQVMGRTRLTYKYDSEYLSGKRSWQDIKFSTTIDSNVEYVPNSLKYIDVNNLVTNLPDSLWTSHFSLETVLEDLDLTKNKGTLTFDVKTKKVSKNTLVTEKAEYKGSNLILRTTAKNYTIIPQVNIGMDQRAVVKKVKQADSEYTTILATVGGDEVIYKNTLTLEDEAIGEKEYIMSFQLPRGVDYEEDSLTINGVGVAESQIVSTANGLIQFYVPETAASPTETTYDITLVGKLKADLSDQSLTSRFEIYEATKPAAISTSNDVTLTIPKQEYGTVTFYYKDEAGVELLPSKEITGKVGATYPEEIPPGSIRDFDYFETIGNASGTFTLKPQEVIFKYKENPGEIKVISWPKTIDFGKVNVRDYQKPIGVDGTTLTDALVVEDTRKQRDKWDLTAQVTKELTNGGDIQVGALRYVYNKKELTLNDQEQPIYYNDGKSSDTLYPISDNWDDDVTKEGLKLRMTSNRVPNTTGSYEGVIKWNLRKTIDY